MTVISTPIFALTTDIDWASEACIADLFGILDEAGIQPVVMATHDSALVSERARDGRIELGLHPNFNPGSSHGTSIGNVIEHVFRLFPAATTFRSHGFTDSTAIAREMVKRGIRYDSNLCLHLQSDLAPLQHACGLMRFPVFWEDDVNAAHGGSWQARDVLDRFLTPGLKVLNCHPAWIALNIPDDAFYQQHRAKVASLSTADIERLRHPGAGARTFLIDLLRELKRLGHRFHTLADLHRMFAPQPHAEGSGRQDRIDETEYDRYWSGTDQERQDLLRDLYNKRGAADPYATSRDVNLRDLEIAAIAPFLPQSGRIVDLGCGNGHTLLSLLPFCGDCDLVGVDFASNLIEGAKALGEKVSPRPKRAPQFLCADAIRYVSELPSNSVTAVLTERFMLNLPSPEMQRRVIRECHRVLAPGGRLLMCEASADGFEALNALRRECGLTIIPETSTDNISAIRFNEREVDGYVHDVGFRSVAKQGFSQFFIISRVLHPLLVQPLSPRFGAPINALARTIQSHLPLEPGIGSNVLWVLEKP